MKKQPKLVKSWAMWEIPFDDLGETIDATKDPYEMALRRKLKKERDEL